MLVKLSSFEGTNLKPNSLVTMARRSHPFPYRTRKLSFSAPMVVRGCPLVRVGRRQARPLFGAIILSYFKGKILLWPVGQAVKTPPFHGGNTGSNPVRVTKNGGLAQLGEHLPYKQRVGGSIPSSSTIKICRPSSIGRATDL